MVGGDEAGVFAALLGDEDTTVGDFAALFLFPPLAAAAGSGADEMVPNKSPCSLNFYKGVEIEKRKKKIKELCWTTRLKGNEPDNLSSPFLPFSP